MKTITRLYKLFVFASVLVLALAASASMASAVGRGSSHPQPPDPGLPGAGFHRGSCSRLHALHEAAEHRWPR